MLTPGAAQLLLADHGEHHEAPHTRNPVDEQHRKPGRQGAQTLPHAAQTLGGGGVHPCQGLVEGLGPVLLDAGCGMLRRLARFGEPGACAHRASPLCGFSAEDTAEAPEGLSTW